MLQDNNFENESIQVINEVKNTIASIIKDVISQEKSDDEREKESNIDKIVEKIKEKVPDEVKIKTSQVDEKELQDKIKETVGKILTDDEINSIVELRNISRSDAVNDSFDSKVTTQIFSTNSETITESTTFSNNSTASFVSTQATPNIESLATESLATALGSSSTIQTINPSSEASSTIVSTNKIEKDEASNELPEYNDKSNEVDSEDLSSRGKIIAMMNMSIELILTLQIHFMMMII